ncbi:ABC transporter substrate-binding protein [Candidatus Pacearchaeota archaeon]|nr:ABC transporter substrate-binding protein [Candidatus Pacearchaeota archaeon]
MKKQNKKMFWAVILIALVVIFVVFNYVRSEEEERIKIGVTATLTGFGAPWGEDIQKGIDLAVKEVNDEGGIYGKQLEIIYEDISELDLKMAVSAAQKFVSIDKVDLIFTQWAEDNAVVQPIAEENNILIMNIASGSRDVPRGSPYVFMIRPTDAEVTERLVDYIISLNVDNPVMIVEQTPYFESLGALTDEIWNQKTGQNIRKYSASPTERDYRTILTKVKQEGYDVVFVYVLEDNAGLVLKNIEEFGIEALKIGFTGMGDPVVLNVAKESAEGMVYTDFDSSEQFFIEKFKNEYGREPLVTSDLAYDAIKVLAKVMREYGTDTESVKKGLELIKDFPGASGPVTFNELGERTGKEVIIKVIRDGVGVKI